MKNLRWSAFTPRVILLGVVGATFLLLALVIVAVIIIVGREDEAAPPEETVVNKEVEAESEAGVDDHKVLFGQSAALTGPAQELGLKMRLGIEAAFSEVNGQGGVAGRQLQLVSLDDAYEPEVAIRNTVSLIENEVVFALIGAVGTPTSRATVPVALKAGVPYVAPFTGAEFLREPEWVNVVNLRASYHQETERMVAHLIDDLNFKRIAVIYQDDSFGRGGLEGVRSALARRDMTPSATGVYPRNTVAVKTALLDLRQGDPQAVIVIGAYRPVAALVSLARLIGIEAIFMTTSFAGSSALAQDLADSGSSVFITQVVPSPFDASLPVVSAYRSALSAYDPNAPSDFVSFEGYLAGRLAIAGVQACGQDLDRECFLQSILDDDDVDINGFKLRYDGDNQGSDEVFLTVTGSDGQYHSIDSLKDPAP